MEIEIDYTISAGKNAEKKYSDRNKFKKKLDGLYIAMEHTQRKLEDLKQNIKKQKSEINITKKTSIIKKQWYSKFRWFLTTNGFLVLAGRDAKNNETLIKKHMDDSDLYFHADIHGAPHTILKNPNKIELNEIDVREAANFAMCFSSAWKNKMQSVDVYSVNPDQVTKTANTGESVGTGAFVIRGKREYFRKLPLELGVYFHDNREIIAAPLSAVKVYSKNYFVVVPGDLKKSEVTKDLKNRFEKNKIKLAIEEVDSVLPPGNSQIK